MSVRLEQAVYKTGGHVFERDRFPAELRVVTDTRSIAPGDTFLALRGEHFDGHSYVGEAIAKGAAAVVVEREAALPPGIPALLVADTKRAYMNLAAAARDDFQGQVVGITGSAGKTTTKHILAQLAATHYGTDRVLASPANENNEIGVSKLLLAASPERQVLVVEMGARHEGDIAELVQIARPHIGVLTNIGEAHLEIFGSRETLARTKWGLFSLGAQAVLNARDSESARRAAALQTPPLWFGVGEPALPGVWLRDAKTLVLNYGAETRELEVDVRLPGAHNLANAAAAIGAALLLGIQPGEIASALSELTLPAGRYEVVQIGEGTRVIYDAYNANASGMMATLDAFAQEAGERRIAVLASMAELGEAAAAMHERVGAHAARANVDMLLVGGEYASSIAAGAVAAGFPQHRIVRFETNGDAVVWLREHARPSDVVLLKGSRKYKMEEIVAALQPARGAAG